MAALSLNSTTRHFIAELLGTTFLTMTVAVALIARTNGIDFYFGLFLPFAAGLVVALLVYIFAGISGTHFNPAVSVALFLQRRMSLTYLVIYLIAQILGAVLGAALTRLLFGEYAVGPTSVSVATAIGEFLGAFLLVFTVTRVALGAVSAQMSGLVVGLSIVIGATITAGVDSGIFNPALALGLGSYSYTYLLLPLIGGAVGAALATVLTTERTN